jgi:Rrf2 family protein
MLTLRRETDYAIHLLKHLTQTKGDFVSLRILAEATGISFLFLQKIARKLRQARLIKAGTGMSGGYCLNIPPDKITLKKIIEATEGPGSVFPCLCNKNAVKCPGRDKKCPLKTRLGKINKQIDDIFIKTKLKNL